MLKLSARKLLPLSPNEIAEQLTGEFILVCDDGEIKTNAKQMYINSHCWMLHRWFKELPILVKHTLSYHLPEGSSFKDSTHVCILNDIVSTWHEVYPNFTHKQQSDMLRILYLVMNHIYNNAIDHCREFMSSLDVTDMINICYHPSILDIKQNGDYSQLGIKEIQSKVISTIKEDPVLKQNIVSRMLRTGAIKSGQLAQSIGPYGYPTDVDSFPFPKPIMRGYFEGIRNFYESIVESRTAALALYNASSPLQFSEYFSRKTQFTGCQVETVERGDCGSTDYHYRKVKNETELRTMDGIYYWDNHAKELKCIDADNDKHLIGKIVPMRALWHCRHKVQGHVCSTCLGKVSQNIVESTNIGHQGAVTLNSKVSQKIMSTKHEIGSGFAAGVVPSTVLLNYFKLTDDGMGYILADTIKDKKVAITIAYDSLLNITDALEIDDLSLIAPDAVTSIDEVIISVTDPKTKKTTSEKVTLSYQGRLAYMTREMLSYMKGQDHWSLSNRGHYVIDLVDWTKDKILFRIPPKQYNTMAYASSYKDLLESKTDSIKERDENTDIAVYFEEIVSTVHEKIPEHLSVLQIIAYSTLVTSSKHYEGALPKPWTDCGVGVYNVTMKIRSLGPAMAYQAHAETLTAPSTFMVTNRPDHLFDWFLLPQEVKKYRKPKMLDISTIY